MAVDEPALDATLDPALDLAWHIKYWQRCFATHLLSAYTANDSTRLTFAYFVVAALDVLTVPLPTRDRAAVCAWVLRLQHLAGGFCGSPAPALGARGHANLAATFALLLLGAVADDGRARRRNLRWLRRLQRLDGSFGQVLWEGAPVGGRDMCHSYLASGVRWMLHGHVAPGDAAWEEDFDVGAMVAHIRRG